MERAPVIHYIRIAVTALSLTDENGGNRFKSGYDANRMAKCFVVAGTTSYHQNSVRMTRRIRSRRIWPIGRRPM
jgi:hypothetical protein